MPLVIILWRSTLWCLLEIDVYRFYLLNHWNIIPLNYLQVYGCVLIQLGLLPTQKSNSLLAMLPLINSSRSYFCSWPLPAVQSTSEVQHSRVMMSHYEHASSVRVVWLVEARVWIFKCKNQPIREYENVSMQRTSQQRKLWNAWVIWCRITWSRTARTWSHSGTSYGKKEKFISIDFNKLKLVFIRTI